MRKVFTFIGLLMCLSSIVKAQFAVDCTPSLELWFNTHTSGSIDNSGPGVIEWEDVYTDDGSPGYHLVADVGNNSTYPSLVSDAINGYDAVSFSGGDFLRCVGVDGADLHQILDQTAYFVMQSSSTGAMPLFAHGDGSARSMILTEGMYWGTGWRNGSNTQNSRKMSFLTAPNTSQFDIRTYVFSASLPDFNGTPFPDTSDDSGFENQYYEYINGSEVQFKQGLYQRNISDVTDTLIVGAYRGNNLNATIAEFMLYRVSHDEFLENTRKEMLSYLSLKYGISLDRTSPYHQYTNHDDDDIYPLSTTCGGSTYSDYSHRITGLYKEANGCYGLRHSKSTNQETSEAILTGAYTGRGGSFNSPDDFNKNRQSFLWGDNGSTKTFQTGGNTTDVPAALGITRMERVYKVRETITKSGGLIDEITYQFDLSTTDVPTNLSNTDVWILVDTDLDGSFEDETVSGGGAFNPSVADWTASSRTGFFEYNFDNCQMFTIGIGTAALPVSWLDFTAKDIETKVNLDWSTATEINNSHFVIERSADGQEWTSLGTVSGSGTVQNISNYSFKDNAPHTGINYYRIKQVDFDGMYSYSTVELVVFANGFVAESAVFPNPAENNVTIDVLFNTSNIQIQLTDLAGNVLLTDQMNGERKDMDISSVAPGIYLLKLDRGQGATVHKIVKQ